MAFYPIASIRSLDDVRQLEDTPLAQSLTAKTTYDIFVNSAAAFGDKVALRFLTTAEPGAENIAWSYSDLLRGIHQTANMLHELGVGEQGAVSILLPGCLEYHLALWGGEAAGIINPLNPLLSEDNLVELMRASNTRVLIAYGDEAEYWNKALGMVGKVASLKTIIRVSPHDGEGRESRTSTPLSHRAVLPNRTLGGAEGQNKDTEMPFAKFSGASGDGSSANIINFHQAIAQQPDDHLISARKIQPDDIAAYFHTGGTTGAPKLAIHTHGNQVFTAWASVQLQNINQDDSTINGYPLFHVAGVLPGSLASLSAGVEIIIPTTSLMRNRDIIRNYWKLVAHHKITVVSAVPTALGALANVPLDGADISTIRFCRTGAAPVPAELVERYQALFNLKIQESLGMTEMAGISSITPPGVPSPVGCVGFPLPFSRYKIVALEASGEPGARELPSGETGLILVKSPNVFPGYVDPEATKKAFTSDGWLNTGDLGFIDVQGRINLNGRAKDLIIRSGHNIDPKMIEEVLAAHPAVELCAAVGAPDDYAGEVPVAFVTLNQRGGDGGVNESGVSEAELLAFAAEHVAEIPAKPKSVTVLDVMPLTNVGKIFKPELRRLAALKSSTVTPPTPSPCVRVS